jgi:glycosyltransferase involved in cell wall biosynthesis
MHILFCNSYSMPRMRELWLRGEYPAQHLWAADRLEQRGWHVSYVPYEPSTRLGRAAKRAEYFYGDPDQEARTWKLAREDPSAICYSGNSRSTRLLQALRAAHGWRTPICCVFHHRVPTGRLMRYLVNGIDGVVCLNREAQKTLVDEMGMRPEQVAFAPWGPDLGFEGYHEPVTDEGLIVSAGKTKRDLDTLLAALRDVPMPARVYSMEPRRDVPSNVELVLPELQPDNRRVEFDFPSVLADLRRASMIAIPLSDANRLAGLTELNDALALSKPVVMTASSYMEVDIEEIGCGCWVALGDRDGWAQALCDLAASAEKRHEMGARGRAFAEDRWHYDLFSDSVAEMLEVLQQQRGNGRPSLRRLTKL